MKLEYFFVVALVLGLMGCDSRKDERNALRLQLDETLSTVSAVESKIRDFEVRQNNLNPLSTR